MTTDPHDDDIQAAYVNGHAHGRQSNRWLMALGVACLVVAFNFWLWTPCGVTL